MAFTSDHLAALEAAAASGVLRVQVGDKVMQYQSLADLLAAIRHARRDVERSSRASLGPAIQYPVHHRG